MNPSHAIVEVTLEGSVRADEMQQFVEQAVSTIRGLVEQGRNVTALADLRHFRTTSPEATEILRQGQQAAMQAGMKRIAELVGGQLATLQLNRIARASGMAARGPSCPRQALVFCRIASVNVVEKAGGLEVATDQAALGGSCRVSSVGVGVSVSPMASTPM